MVLCSDLLSEYIDLAGFALGKVGRATELSLIRLEKWQLSD